MQTPSRSRMAQGSVIEGVSDSALCIFILSVSSVAGLLGYEYIKAMEYSRVSSGGSLQEPSAMEALWAYLLGYSEPQLILPANAAGQGDHSRTRAEGFERGQVSLAGGERSEQRDCAIPTCPICLENVEYGIETSCGHAVSCLFCFRHELSGIVVVCCSNLEHPLLP